MTIEDTVREIYYAAMQIHEPFASLSGKAKEQAMELLSRFDALELKHGPLPYRQLLRPMLLSKNGQYEAALAMTEQQYREAPDWTSAVAVANAARRAGNLERAIAMFTAAGRHDPDDVSCWLEVGDIHLEQQRFAEALEAYELVLAKERDHQWALPSAFYCRHRLGIVGQWLASLREVANQEGCTCGMQGCLQAVLGGYGSDDGIARASYLLDKEESRQRG